MKGRRENIKAYEYKNEREARDRMGREEDWVYSFSSKGTFVLHQINGQRKLYCIKECLMFWWLLVLMKP
jgi:hypothetical protein